MTLVELEPITEQQWAELIDGEREPWGDDALERFSWRAKTRTVGVRTRGGKLVAVAGTVCADVRVAGADPFAVLGLGGVFVTRDARGRGLVSQLLDALLAPAGEAGPDRAMLFCRAPLLAMYSKFDFRKIADPVWAEQPDGPVRMPLSAMWCPLRAAATWPAGRVDVLGLPF